MQIDKKALAKNDEIDGVPEIRDIVDLRRRNIESLRYNICFTEHHLLYLALSKQFCDKYRTEENECCDCVNFCTAQMMGELYPNGGGFGSKMKKQVQFASAMGSYESIAGFQRNEENVLNKLKSKVYELKRAVGRYEYNLNLISNHVIKM